MCKLGFALAYIHSVNLPNTVFCLSLVSAYSTTVTAYSVILARLESCQGSNNYNMHGLFEIAFSKLGLKF